MFPLIVHLIIQLRISISRPFLADFFRLHILNIFQYNFIRYFLWNQICPRILTRYSLLIGERTSTLHILWNFSFIPNAFPTNFSQSFHFGPHFQIRLFCASVFSSKLVYLIKRCYNTVYSLDVRPELSPYSHLLKWSISRAISTHEIHVLLIFLCPPYLKYVLVIVVGLINFIQLFRDTATHSHLITLGSYSHSIFLIKYFVHIFC